MISTRSLYGFTQVCCRNTSKKSHDGRIECKHIHRKEDHLIPNLVLDLAGSPFDVALSKSHLPPA